MDPVLIRDALEAVFSATNNYHRAARALRNRLVVMTALAMGFAVVLVLLQWRLPRLHILLAPGDKSDLPAWQLLLLVMLFGAIGALLTTIRPVSTLPPAMSPFNFPLQQAILKIAVGTLTAPLGVLGLAAASGVGSTTALLFAAAGFGAAQQSVTRLLDDRATALVASGPTAPA